MGRFGQKQAAARRYVIIRPKVTAIATGLAAAVLAAVPVRAATDPAAPARDKPVAPPTMDGEPMAFIGIGNAQSCADFLRAVATEREAPAPGPVDPNVFHTTLFGALMAWADGYITAKNEDELLHRVTGSNTTLAQRARWLELFCQANPEATFFAAVYRLRDHLVAEGL